MERLGRYTLVRKLAVGGMAEVFLAKAAGPGGFEKSLVIKRILPQFAERELFVKMFLAEARIAAQLDHPNIVQIFDFGEADGSYYLAMEYIDGLTLRGLVRWISTTKEELSPILAARIVSLACEGLAYAHEFKDPESGEPMKLIHRDVSAENIMVARSGAVKVLDFGIAKVAGQKGKTRLGSLKGKVAYMPPEQIRDLGFDLRIDVYALGVVLYQLLCGRRPYEQQNEIALLSAILTEAPTPLLERRPNVAKELAVVVGRAIARDRDARYSDCRAMQEALESWVAKRGEPAGSSQLAQLVAKVLASGIGDSASDSSSGISSMPGLRTGVGRTSAGKMGWAIDAPASPVIAPQPVDDEAQTPPPDEPTPVPADDEPTPVPDELTPVPEVEEFEFEEVIAAEAVSDAPVTAEVEIEIPLAPTPARPPPKEPRAAARSKPAREPARLDEAQPLAYSPCNVAPEPIQKALRRTALADRSQHLLRKLPPLIGRLLEATREVPPTLRQTLAGVIDVALLTDDHKLLRKLTERAAAKPGTDGRFAALVYSELASPLRLSWLVERFQLGPIADLESLRAWINPMAAQPDILLRAVDAAEPGPGQDFLCDMLAPMIASDMRGVVGRLESPKPRNLAAMCYLLEKGQSKERQRVFQRLMLKRDPAWQMEIMTGRAKWGGVEVVGMLEAALGDPNEAIRRHALKLLGKTQDERAVDLLVAQVKSPSFDSRPPAEKVACWAALGTSGSVPASAFLEQTVLQKAPLLGKKKSIDAKQPAVEALGELSDERSGKLLEKLAGDRGQPEEVQAFARAAIARRQGADLTLSDPKGKAERRAQLARAVCLDVLYLARAASTVDLGSGALDMPLERLREAVRQTVSLDRKLKLVAEETGMSVNGLAVSFGYPLEQLSVEISQALRAKDFKSLEAETPIPSAEMHAVFLRLFDPDGEAERFPHVRAETVSGRSLAPAPPPAPPAFSTARAKELFHQAVDLLCRERDAVWQGKPPRLAEAHAILDEWAELYSSGKPRVMGLVPVRQDDDAFAFHAANTALTSVAFASDLGFGRTHLRELAELGLFWTLAEVEFANKPRPPPGEPARESVRMRTAWYFLSQLADRRAGALAVAAIDAGNDARDDPAQAPGIIPSILVLAEAYDALTVAGSLAPAEALKAMEGRLRQRFQPDLLKLFTTWLSKQTGLEPNLE